MKKFLIFIGLIALFSFNNQQKKLKLEVTLEDANTIYKALGKLPAEESESIRSYIQYEYAKQFADTTKKK